jgi:FlaA1/EpsC-like NDP-sugar epimerase
MRKYLCLLPLLLTGLAAHAQSNALASFNLQQAETLKFGMLALGAWALLNIVIGSFKLTKSSRNKRYFYQMNIYWNIVNVILAGGCLYFILSANAAGRTLPESTRFHFWYMKLLYLSIGLDVAFLMLGAYLKERAKSSPKAEQYLGWGQSIVLQGFFLLALDVVLVILLEQPVEQLLRLLQP